MACMIEICYVTGEVCQKCAVSRDEPRAVLKAGYTRYFMWTITYYDVSFKFEVADLNKRCVTEQHYLSGPGVARQARGPSDSYLTSSTAYPTLELRARAPAVDLLFDFLLVLSTSSLARVECVVLDATLDYNDSEYPSSLIPSGSVVIYR